MKADPLAEALTGLEREKWIISTTDQMATRAGISQSLGRVILAMARVSCRNIGKPVDMVLVAQAISYAGKNKHRLIRRY